MEMRRRQKEVVGADEEEVEAGGLMAEGKGTHEQKEGVTKS